MLQPFFLQPVELPPEKAALGNQPGKQQTGQHRQGGNHPGRG